MLIFSHKTAFCGLFFRLKGYFFVDIAFFDRKFYF